MRERGKKKAALVREGRRRKPPDLSTRSAGKNRKPGGEKPPLPGKRKKTTVPPMGKEKGSHVTQRCSLRNREN